MLALLALGIGFLGVVAMAVAHDFGLTAIARLKPNRDRWPRATIHVAFLGLLLLHLVEILAFSLLNGLLMQWEAFAAPEPENLGWVDTVYLTGINFTTLGYTQIKLSEAFRLVTMMQALGGFMFLTWSATYLYSVCERSWKQAEQE